MQLIFKYDVVRLTSYAVHSENNIDIAKGDSFIMLSFPEVEYFNYAFTPNYTKFSEDKIHEVERYYRERKIERHKIIVSAGCEESNQMLNHHNNYKYLTAISKTALKPNQKCNVVPQSNLEFIKADNNNIDLFASLYLKSFESRRKASSRVVDNFKSLLKLSDLELFMLKIGNNYLGVNVLYQSATESLLAGGAILPEYRNRGFHQQGIKFRINKALGKDRSRKVVAWAYNPSISLSNMMKMEMEVLENFNVYEYCG